MLDTIQSANYRISQVSKFDDVKVPIEPHEKTKTAFFLLDTGIDDHYDIDFYKSDKFKDFRDVNGHGTNLAYVVKDLDPSIQIFNCKVTNGTTVSHQDIINVFEKIIEFKNTNDIPVVVNCSWNVELNEETQKVIERCASMSNVHVFCAIGENGKKYDALPGNAEGVYKVGCLNTNLVVRRSTNIGADFYVAADRVQTEDSAIGGSSVASVMAASMMCMLYSYVDQNNIDVVFEKFINEEKDQLVWPFVYNMDWNHPFPSYNLDALPSIKNDFIYTKAEWFSKALSETPVYSITDNNLLYLNENNQICANGELETNTQYKFKIKAAFDKFDLETAELLGYSEERIEGYHFEDVELHLSIIMMIKM